jgi:succinate dehydrogenase/fumarate reductase-like Fe-S protein
MAVLEDLVADLTALFAQYELIEPWLQSDQPPPDRERRQSPEDRAKWTIRRLIAWSIQQNGQALCRKW